MKTVVLLCMTLSYVLYEIKIEPSLFSSGSEYLLSSQAYLVALGNKPKYIVISIIDPEILLVPFFQTVQYVETYNKKLENYSFRTKN